LPSFIQAFVASNIQIFVARYFSILLASRISFSFLTSQFVSISSVFLLCLHCLPTHTTHHTPPTPHSFRSLERDSKQHLHERVQALKLVRRLLGCGFAAALSRAVAVAMVAVASQPEDDLKRACIDTLRQLGMASSDCRLDSCFLSLFAPSFNNSNNNNNFSCLIILFISSVESSFGGGMQWNARSD
jgi:hypothetical protein